MKKKVAIFSVIAILVLGAGYAALQIRQSKTAIGNQPSVPADKKTEPQATSEPSSQNEAAPSAAAPEQQPLKVETVKAFVSYAIVYTDNGFLPANLQIKKGDTVTFENRSTKGMWPASAAHPSHKEYPTTGGCVGSTFDACKNIPPKEEWSFKFDTTGTWKYHDHLNPAQYGSVIVAP